MKPFVFRLTLFLLISLAPSSAIHAQVACEEYLAPMFASSHFLATNDGTNGRYSAIASQDGFFYSFNKGTTVASSILLRCYELGGHLGQRPVLRSSVGMPASGNRIVLIGTHAYFPLSSLGVGAVDISNPDVLPPATITGTGDVCRDLAALGSDHIITAEWSAIRIYHLLIPATPMEIAGLTLSQARSVAVAGDLAYVACGYLGLAVVDISNPAVPSLAAQIPVGGFVDQVAAVGNRVYLTGFQIGLVTVDSSSPNAPEVLDVLPLMGEPERIEIRDGYAYIIVGEAVTVIPGDPDWDTMALVRLDSTNAPSLVDYFFPSKNYSSLALGDDLVLLGETDDDADLILAPLNCPAPSGLPDIPALRFALSTPWPNPFNPRVSLRFNLPPGKAGRVAVHDLRGNLVAEIWRGTGDGRATTVYWDGTDRNGKNCPSGSYRFLLSADQDRSTTWVAGTLLR